MPGLKWRRKPALIIVVGDDGAFILPSLLACDPFFVRLGDTEKMEQVSNLLLRHPKLKVTLLINQLAQDYKIENLPKLNPFDRRKIIDRRLRHAFSDADIRAYLPSHVKPRQILGIGLYMRGALMRWLDISKDHHPYLALLPVECATMLSRLYPAAADGWGLWLSPMPSGGLRQIVTYKGELFLTRLTHAADTNDHDYAALAKTVMKDIKSSVDYLGRHGMVDGQEMHLVITAPENWQPWLEKELAGFYKMQFLTLSAAASILGLDENQDSPLSADYLCASWVAKQPRLLLPLRGISQRRLYRTKLFQDWGQRIALAMLICIFSIVITQTGFLIVQCVKLHDAAQQLSELQIRQAAKRQTSAPSTEPSGRLRMALERREFFNAGDAMPWDLLRQLDKGLGADARLTKFDWQRQGAKNGMEVAHVNLRLTDSAAPTFDKRHIVTSFETTADHINQSLIGYKAVLTHFPFPALPHEILSATQSAAAEANAHPLVAEMTIMGTDP